MCMMLGVISSSCFCLFGVLWNGLNWLSILELRNFSIVLSLILVICELIVFVRGLGVFFFFCSLLMSGVIMVVNLFVLVWIYFGWFMISMGVVCLLVIRLVNLCISGVDCLVLVCSFLIVLMVLL